MKIAICDDKITELIQMSTLLEEYREDYKAGFTYKTFSNAMELLEEMRHENFDILFLDILMPGISGMQAAHEIRIFNEHAKLIFFTVSKEFAIESYSVGATAYLLKPLKRETLFPLLDKLFNDAQREIDFLAVRCKTGLVRILFSKLSHVEVLGKTLSFHMNNGVVYEANASLSEYEEIILSHPEIMRVHRAFLVNLWQMQELNAQNFITLSGKIVPVSRRLHNKVRNAFMKSLFDKKETKIT